jgi:AraC-like DNA-binding protein
LAQGAGALTLAPFSGTLGSAGTAEPRASAPAERSEPTLPTGAALWHRHGMENGVICEIVDVLPHSVVHAERIVEPSAAPPVEPFPHFHDVCELVVFRHAAGSVESASGRFAIGPGTLVYLPSMEAHEFVIDGGAREWVLLHVDPALVESLAVEGGQSALRTPICRSLGAGERARFDLLLDWLIELSGQPMPCPQRVSRVVELLLLQAATESSDQPETSDHRPGMFNRLRPALRLVADGTYRQVSLEDAATACNLSPSYFSRQFKQVFGMPFNDYARGFRLRLAARRIVSGGERISDIAYALGFGTHAHFAAAFAKRYGMSPRDYRANGRPQ